MGSHDDRLVRDLSSWPRASSERTDWNKQLPIVGCLRTTLHLVRNRAPHDLCRSCARLCHAAGGDLDQIQFLLGHVSIQTTERYVGCKQRIRSAVNDRIGIEPAA